MSRVLISKDRQNIIMLITGDGSNIFCDGQSMDFLIANTVDAAHEKHVPQVSNDGKKVRVKVGSIPHPMLEQHWIQWIYLQTKNGGQYRHLSFSDKPEAEFILTDDDEIVAAYEYCNLHGLWKTNLK